jgi:hypothetical protein
LPSAAASCACGSPSGSLCRRAQRLQHQRTRQRRYGGSAPPHLRAFSSNTASVCLLRRACLGMCRAPACSCVPASARASAASRRALRRGQRLCAPARQQGASPCARRRGRPARAPAAAALTQPVRPRTHAPPVTRGAAAACLERERCTG